MHLYTFGNTIVETSARFDIEHFADFIFENNRLSNIAKFMSLERIQIDKHSNIAKFMRLERIQIDNMGNNMLSS